MYFNGAYNKHNYNAQAMRAVVSDLVRMLPRIIEQTGADTIVVTGKSGISVAMAALMVADFPLVVVRKDGEGAHGNKIEGPEGHNVLRYLILDDFVSSGNTVRRVIDKLEMEASRQGDLGAVECVGIIEYLHTHNYSDGSPRGLKEERYNGWNIPYFRTLSVHTYDNHNLTA